MSRPSLVPLLLALQVASVRAQEPAPESMNIAPPDSTLVFEQGDASLAARANMALLASLLATALPVAAAGGTQSAAVALLGVVGLVAGPSTGYFTAGLTGRGARSLGLRSVGLGALVAAVAICPWDCAGEPTAAALAIGGGSILLVSGVIDLVSVRGDVLRHGREAAAGEARSVVAPNVDVRTGAVGLSVRVTH